MSPAGMAPWTLQGSLVVIGCLVCIVRDVPCISDPTYELGIRQARRTSLPLEETSLRGSEFIKSSTIIAQYEIWLLSDFTKTLLSLLICLHPFSRKTMVRVTFHQYAASLKPYMILSSLTKIFIYLYEEMSSKCCYPYSSTPSQHPYLALTTCASRFHSLDC